MSIGDVDVGRTLPERVADLPGPAVDELVYEVEDVRLDVTAELIVESGDLATQGVLL